ncbi:hypothetical protein MESS2_p90018 [Mesorhizobium metallidurans STM 2683]|uniref:Uncharacterized protein n=1 Tax=Mesorhizobium metallidurans STM 2683 TaxID=1297569 RepID=M5EX09_9HYPH|nr:hypothetical protein MESS2_p90018 [Mesorhizobium metallidurans STM 2683]
MEEITRGRSGAVTLLEIYAAGHKRRHTKNLLSNSGGKVLSYMKIGDGVWKRVRRLAMLPVYQPRP